MTIIRPFRGYRYDPKAVGSLSKVITPPYDVINKKQQASYYRTHPHNFIRLDLGKTSPSDNEKNNRYTRAARSLGELIDKGILARDLRESVYVYDQEYTVAGRKRRDRPMAASAPDLLRGRDAAVDPAGCSRPHSISLEERPDQRRGRSRAVLAG